MDVAVRIPSLIDANYTGFLLAWTTGADNHPIRQRHPALGARVTWEQTADYKYVVAIDGASYATGFGGYLLLTAVVLRQESSMPMWFEGALRENVDYVQVAEDFGDLQSKIEQLQKDDERARQIAESGHLRIMDLFSGRATICYMHQLLMEYHRRRDPG